MYNNTGKVVFLGIDVHKKTYSVTAMVDNSIIKRATMLAKPEELISFCRRNFSNALIYSAYEASFCGLYLHRKLKNAGIENIVVNPASIEVEARSRTKNDKRDSKKIAEQLSAGRLKSIFIPSEEREQMRLVTRLYETYVRHKHRVGCQLKFLFYQFGLIDCCDKRKVSSKWISSVLELNLPPAMKWCAKKLANLWLYLSNCIKEIKKEIKVQSIIDAPVHEIYQSFKGVGMIIARILANELADMSQFSNEKKLYAFTGLTPQEYSTGDNIRLGHISHQGNPLLRKILVESCWKGIQMDENLREDYQKLATRVGKKKAIVAIARKRIGHMRSSFQKGKVDKKNKKLISV